MRDGGNESLARADGRLWLAVPDRKRIRARVIKAHVDRAGYRGVVCFSCGHAAQALRDVGLDVVEVSPGGPLRPGRWWTPAEIRRVWPDRFDATAGHLPAPLMVQIAQALKDQPGQPLGPGPYKVATGSGETISCLRWAYPTTQFIAVYNCGGGQGTAYEPDAPLNMAVRAMGPVEGQGDEVPLT